MALPRQLPTGYDLAPLVGPFISSGGAAYYLTHTDAGGAVEALKSANPSTTAFTTQDSLNAPDSAEIRGTSGSNYDDIDVFQVSDVLHVVVLSHTAPAMGDWTWYWDYFSFDMSDDTWDTTTITSGVDSHLVDPSLTTGQIRIAVRGFDSDIVIVGKGPDASDMGDPFDTVYIAYYDGTDWDDTNSKARIDTGTAGIHYIEPTLSNDYTTDGDYTVTWDTSSGVNEGRAVNDATHDQETEGAVGTSWANLQNLSNNVVYNDGGTWRGSVVGWASQLNAVRYNPTVTEPFGSETEESDITGADTPREYALLCYDSSTDTRYCLYVVAGTPDAIKYVSSVSEATWGDITSHSTPANDTQLVYGKAVVGSSPVDGGDVIAFLYLDNTAGTAYYDEIDISDGATTATTGTGALSLTGIAPTATVPEKVTTGTGSLSLAGFAPTALIKTAITTGTAALTIGGFAPAAISPTDVTTGTGSLVIDGIAPTPALPPEVWQQNYAWGEPGTEAGHTIFNTNEDLTLYQDGQGNSLKFLRIGANQVRTDATVELNFPRLRLMYSHNSGAWTRVTTTSTYVEMANNGDIVDGTDTTDRIAPAAGFLSNNNAVTETDALVASFNWTANSVEHMETLFSLRLIDADLTAGDTVDLRLMVNVSAGNDAPLAGYTVAAARVTWEGAITPGTASLDLTGIAPSIQQGTKVTTGTGSLVLTGIAPIETSTVATQVTTGTGALSLTGFAPSVTEGATTSTGALSLTGIAPTALIDTTVTSGTGALTLTGIAPTATVNTSVTTGTGSLVLTGVAPTSTENDKVTTGTGALTLTGIASTATYNQGVTSGTGALVLTGIVPTPDYSLIPATAYISLGGPTLHRTFSGLLGRHHNDDATNYPFATSDWTMPSSGLSVAKITNRLRFSQTGGEFNRWAEYNLVGDKTKGFVHCRFQREASGGDVGIFVIASDINSQTGIEGRLPVEYTGSRKVRDFTGGTPTDISSTASLNFNGSLRVSLWADDTNAYFREFSTPATESGAQVNNPHKGKPGFMVSAGVSMDVDMYDFVYMTDRYITVDGLGTSYVVKIINTDDSVIDTQTESGGTGTVTLDGVDAKQWPIKELRVFESDGTTTVAVFPEPFGGDSFTLIESPASAAPSTSITTNTYVTTGTGSLVLSGLAPDEVVDFSVATGTGSLTISGVAPSAAYSQTATTGTGALALTGIAPTSLIDTTVTSGTGSLVLTGIAPATSEGTRVTTGTGALTLTGIAPATSIDYKVTTGTGSLTLTGVAPSASFSQSATTGTGSLVLTGVAPSELIATTVTTGTGSLVLDGIAPSEAIANTATTATGALTLTGIAPTADPTANVWVTTSTGDLVLTGIVPSTALPGTETTGTGVLVLTGIAPSTAIEVTETTATGALVITGIAPTATVTADVSVTTGTGALVLSGLAPSATVTTNQAVTTGTGSLTLGGIAPITKLRVTPSTGSLVLTAIAPSPDFSAWLLTTSTGSLVLNGVSGTKAKGPSNIRKLIELYTILLAQTDFLLTVWTYEELSRIYNE